MFKTIVLLALLTLKVNQLHAQNKNADTCIIKPNTLTCYKLIKLYSKYWIADSLARTGFRNLIGTEFFHSCNCMEGKDWKEVSKYLGKPNFVVKPSKFLEKDEILYRYVIYSYKDLKKYKSSMDVMDIGNKRLDIIVKNGVITSFLVFEVDG